jgi:hypothetical protein
MFRVGTLTLAVILALSIATDSATSKDQPDTHEVVPPTKMPPGQWFVKVWGDFDKPGAPFVIRIHNDAGYIVLPHIHTMDENITIVQGSWSVGTGRLFNRSSLEPMKVGDYAIVPKGMPHFGYAKTDMIQQVHGIGPFQSTLVDPVYQLTNRGVLLLTSLLFPGTPTSASPPDCFVLKLDDRVRGDLGEGDVVGARCSPANKLTQYWIQKGNDERFWATREGLTPP